MTSGPNLRTDYERLGPSKGGFAGAFPTLLEMSKAEMLGAHNLLFQFSSAWYCNSADASGGTGIANSLWNGKTLAQADTIGLNTMSPDPTFRTKNSGTASLWFMPILTPFTGWLKDDFFNFTYTESGGADEAVINVISVQCSIAAGTGAKDRKYGFMIICPRREGIGMDATSRTQDERAKAAIHGGVPSTAADVIQ